MKKLKPSATATQPAADQPLRRNSLALAIAAALSAPIPLYAQSLPTGLQTLSGKVTVTTPTATSMNLNQATQNASMSAQSFSIGFGNRVDITQPAASSVLMVNVVGNNPSNIFGTLTANGQFFLTNSAGVLFGPTASVNVGGLVASTLPISYSDATSGHYVFTNGGNAGGVTVQAGATITALNGYVGLFAPQVANSGLIVARMGTVALAAGNQVTLDMVGDGLIKVSVDQAALNASAMNSGTIQADGGNVLLTARSANALLDTVINTDGVIRANTINNRNGTITLDGGSAGVVSVSGTLQAQGTDAGTAGGNINVLGQYVGIGLPGSTASLNASGDAGGGTILIGGNFHGAGPEANALMTYVGSDATILADAGTSGNGGSLAVWSDGGTRFYGTASLRGGSQSGNGGYAEVSGAAYLDYQGVVDRRAPNGAAGTLLLDPFSDLTVSNAADSVGFTTSPFSPTLASSNISWATITGAGGLGLGNTIVDTTASADNGQAGNINITAGETYSSSNSLTFTSAGGITVGGAITNSGSGALAMSASGGTVSINQAVTTTGGKIDFTGSSGINLGADVTSNGGNITFHSQTALNAASTTVSAGAGAIAFSAGIDGATNSLTTNNTGTWSVGAAINTVANLTIQGGPTSVALPTTTLSGTLDVTAGGLTESGVVTANTLQSTGGITGAVNLGTQTNAISNLGPLTAGTGFTLTDSGALTVTGAVGGGTGLTSITTASGALNVNTAVTGTGVTLATTTSGAINLAADVNAGAGTATLTSAGLINQTGGTLTADTLTGSSATSVNLPTVAATHLGAFSDTTTFTLVNAGALTVNGTVGGATASGLTDIRTTGGDYQMNTLVRGTGVHLESTGQVSNGGGGSVDAGTGTLTLIAGTNVDMGNNPLTAGTVTGSATSGFFDVSLASNALGAVGPVTAGTSISVADSAGGLNVAGAISGGTTVSISTAGGALALGANNVSGVGVTLAASGATGDITSTTGTINGGAGSVLLTAGESVTLGAAVTAGTTNTINFAQSAAGTFSTSAALSGTSVAVNSGTGGSTFDFSGAPATTATLTGSGTDTLKARNAVANSWTINAANGGTVGGLTFSGISSATAGSSGDTFNFSTGTASVATVTGAGGTDVIQNNTGAVRSVVMSGNNAGSAASMITTGFSSIETYTGSGTDSITAPSGGTINVTALDTGNVGGGMGFTGVNTLVSQTAGATFNFTTGTSSVATVTGTGTTDVIQNSTGAARSVVMTGTKAGSIASMVTTGFTGIETYTGGGTDSLTAPAATAIGVSGANTGQVGAGLNFTGVNTLVADGGGTTFNFTGGSVATVTGGAGSDTVTNTTGGRSLVMSTANNGSAASMITTGFTSIETYTGSGTDSITAPAATAIGVSGANAGQVGAGLNFTGVNTLVANAGGTTFNFTGGSVATVTGGAGSDTVTNTTGGRSLVMSGNNAGSAASMITTGFSSIETYTGSGTDSITAPSGGTINVTALDTGNVGGGMGFTGVNTLVSQTAGATFNFTTGTSSVATVTGTGTTDVIQNSTGAARSVVMTGTKAGSIASMVTTGFTGIETYTGGGTDSLTAPAATAIGVSGANTGQVGAGLNFTGVNTLVADGGGTTFNFTGGSVATVTGGAGSDTVTNTTGGRSLVMSTANNGSAASMITTGFTSIETYTGSGTDSITAPAATAIGVSGANAGQVGAGLNFTGVNTLVANAGGTTFNFTGGSVATVTGGAGSDTVTNTTGGRSLVMSTANNGSAASMITTGFTSIETYTGSGTDSITAPAATTMTVNAANAGQVGAGLNFTGVNTLVAAGGGTTFNFSTGTASVATVTGAGGTDVIQNNTGAVRSVVMSGNNAGSAASMITTGFSSIETYTGSGTDSITAPSGGTINVTALDTGNVGGGMGFTGVNTLVSQTAGATFNFTTGTSSVATVTGTGTTDVIQNSTGAARSVVMTGTKAGSIASMVTTGFTGIETYTGGGTDSLTAPAATAIGVSGANTGQVGAGLNFTGVNTLVADGGGTTFNFTGGSVATVTGGAGSDTVTNTTGGRSLVMSTANNGSAASMITTGFTSIETYTGSGTDSITAPAATAIGVSGANAGQVGAGLNFTGVNTLVANAGGTTFNFTGGSVATVTGGAGSDTVTNTTGGRSLVMSGNNAGSAASMITTGFSSIETYTGSGTDSITAPSGGTINVTALDTGNVGGGMGFTGVNTLVSQTAGATFNFTTGTSSVATVTGTGTTDVIQNSTGAARSVVMTGTKAGSIASMVTTGFTGIETYTGGGTDSLTAPAATAIGVSGANTGQVGAGLNFTGVNTLVADGGGTTFNFTGGSVATVTGGAGSDTVTNTTGGRSLVMSTANNGSAASMITTGFTSIETYTGSGTDSITAPAATAIGVSGANAGQVGAGLNFTGVNTLVANAGGTTFNFTGGSVATVTGGAGSDTVTNTTGGRSLVMSGNNAGSAASMITTGFSSIETYTGSGTDSITAPSGSAINVNAANAGNVGGGMTYSGVNTLVADGGGTSFVFTATGSEATVTGAAGSDTLNLSGRGAGQAVTMTGTKAGTIAGVVTTGFSSIETYTGSGTDSITAPSGGTINVTALDTGNVGGGMGFTGVNTLVSQTAGATFNFTTGTSSVATVTGTGTTDVIQNSTGAARSVVMTGTKAGSIASMVTTGFTGIETYTGGGTDSLTAPAATAIGVSGANTGQVGAGLNFTGVNTLVADGGGTTFNFTGGSVATVTGGAGSDTVTNTTGGRSLVMSTANNGSAASMITTGFTSIETYTGSGTDSITAPAATAIGVSGANAGQVGAGLNFTGVNTLVANAGGTTFNFTGGSVATVTGGAGSDVLDISGAGGGKTVTLTGANSGSIATVVTTGFTGVDTITGSGTDTMTGTGQTYVLANGTPDAGSSNSVNWTGFKNITDTTGTVNFQVNGSLTGNLSAQTLNYSTYGQGLTLNVTTPSLSNSGVGGTLTFNGTKTVNANSAQTNTVAGTGQTYALNNATQNQGSGNGFAWTAFQNVNDSTGTVAFGSAGSVSGNVTAQVLDYTGHTLAETYDIANGAGQTTGIGGTHTGVTTVTGGAGTAATNLIKGGATYTLTNGTANSGGDGTITWTNFGALNASTSVNFQNTGSVTGNVTAPTLNFSAYTGAVSATMTGANAGTITGTGGFSGVSTINANGANGNTMGGAGQTYSAFSAATKGTFDANSVAVTNFETITDTGAGVVNMSTAGAAGGVTGNVTTVGGTVTLGAGANVGGNIDTGSGTGTVNMGTAGTIPGTVRTGTLTYANYTVPVTFDVGTGVGNGLAAGHLISLVSVAGSGNSDMIQGSGIAWNITGPNSGTGGGINWSSFENLAASGTTVIQGAGGSLTGNITSAAATTLSGTVTTTGSQTYTGAATMSGAVNVQSTGGGAIGFSSTITGGTNVAIATAGAVNLGGAVSGMTNFYVVGSLPTGAEPNPFADLTNIPKAGSITSVSSITSSSPTTGTITLSATNLSGLTAGTYTTGLLRMNANTAPPLGAVSVNVTNLALSGSAPQWSLGGTVISNTVLTPTGSNFGVAVGGVSLKQSTLDTQANVAASAAQASAVSAAAGEAAKTFGTDSVAEQIEFGFAGDVGNLPPMDHRLFGVGISVPKCFNESREGEDC